MSIFSSVEQDFAGIWDDIKHVFDADVEPVLKAFFEQFATDDGKLILTDGIAATAALAAGTPFAAVGATLFTDLLAKSQTIAAQDAGKTLLQIQSAMTIGKAVQGVLTASDQNTIDSVGPAPTPAPVAA